VTPVAVFIQAVIDSILLGGIYVLMAIGLSLSFGVTRLINFAHGEVVMLGGYGAFWLFTLLHIDPLVALLPLAPLGALLGALLFRTAVTRVIAAPRVNQILLTFGLALVLQNVALLLWTGDERSVGPDYASRSLDLGAGLVVPVASLVAFGVAAVLVAGLFVWLRYSELGRASRALAENKTAAVLMGIDVNKLYAIAFGISVGLGVASGVVLSIIVPITPFMGLPLLKGFCIIVLGGLGSLSGAVVGAFALATAETMVSYYVPDGSGWAPVVALGMLFVMLIIRPQGLLGRVADA
jgi:branched-chain amino acid transport system permease protein